MSGADVLSHVRRAPDERHACVVAHMLLHLQYDEVTVWLRLAHPNLHVAGALTENHSFKRGRLESLMQEEQ